MEANTAGYWIYFNWAFFLLSVAVMVYVGFRAKRIADKDSDGFLVAGRSLGVLVGTCAVVGTGYSGWCFMGAPGVSYAYGPIELLFNFGFAVAHTIAITFFAGHLRKQAYRMKSSTIPEYIAQSHATTDGMARILQFFTGLCTLLLLTVFIIGQIKAVGLLTSQWLGIPPWLASTIVISMIIFYTAFGGLAAVAWTDTLMVFGMCIACIYCVGVCLADNSIMDMVNQLRQYTNVAGENFINPPTAAPYGTHKIAAYFSIPYAFFFAAVLPYMAMRFLAFKDDAPLHKMGLLCTVLCIILSLIPMVGLYMKLKMPDNPVLMDNPNMAMPMFLEHYVPKLIAVVVTLFILFAMQSTANGLLHTLSSALMHDMRRSANNYAPTTPKRAVALNRWGVLILGFIGMLLTYAVPDNVFLNYLNIMGTGTLQAILIGPVFIGTFWRGNAYGALAAMILGGGTAAAWLVISGGSDWVIGPLAGDVVAAVAYVVVSKLTMSSCPRVAFSDHDEPQKEGAAVA